MAKFHINPATGNPGACKALRACPFGGQSEHFDSIEEAREAYETAMAEQSTPRSFRRVTPEEDAAARKTIVERFKADVALKDRELQEAYEAVPTKKLSLFAGLTPEQKTAYYADRLAKLRSVQRGHVQLYSYQKHRNAAEEDLNARNEVIRNLNLEIIDQERMLIPKRTFANYKDVDDRRNELKRAEIFWKSQK